MEINSISSNQQRPPQMDPDAYAQQYANQKGISLDEAKAELKAKFGDPEQRKGPDSNQQVKSGQLFSFKTDETDLVSFNNTTETESSKEKERPDKNIDPETFVQQYANEHNISLKEAKAELKAKYGDPENWHKAD